VQCINQSSRKWRFRLPQLRNRWTDFDETWNLELSPKTIKPTRKNDFDLTMCVVLWSRRIPRLLLQYKVSFFVNFCCMMLCKRGLCRHAVSVCLCVCQVRGLCRNEWIYLQNFSPSDSYTILLFRYQMAGQYSDGNPLTGTSSAGEVCRNRDSEPLSGSIACCERQVQYTQPRRTTASWRH